ncbi:hypothetical protein IVB25_40140 [Bradyrhizobium sp. 193]|uniref:hypothetical protein n=1 Tax=unclassified Bradyrhizobium TaxID=2631580 RepID=UPI0003802A98|nr:MULTISPECIES: hypothetical protein [unclassified Bradyrhizobium]MCK1345475.1 hypothetical protein [Bradyrhizobium sp. CW11]MCK1471128.1 hypothetical protein [Bradyrhizobium sp. CW10]MCK1488727.1 hypothetical protein [Bradyrhizobium sp. 193]MCK1581776.1 hypothetical protein [Bradyrhizobium sp. 168]MCK1586023.1 hypothetical protein [Bradyrhizobium sp. 169]
MVVRLTASELEYGRRFAAKKAAGLVVRLPAEIDDLIPIARLGKRIRELLWHRDDPDNMRACRALVREQARLSLAYERRHGKAPNIKHV